MVSDEKVGLVHQLPVVCKREGFAGTYESVSAADVSIIFTYLATFILLGVLLKLGILCF